MFMKLFKPALILYTVLRTGFLAFSNQGRAAAQREWQEPQGHVDGFGDESSLARCQLGGSTVSIETNSRYMRTGQGSLKVTVPKQAYYVNPRLWDYRLGARSHHVAALGS
jgi:hypothetical protein